MTAVKNSRRSLGLMLLLTALGAVLVLTAAGRTWAEGVVTGVDGGRLDIAASGSKLSGLPSGLALVALAASVAVFAVRGRVRAAVGVLTVLAGLGAVAGAVIGATDTSALDAEAARKLALTSAQAEQISHTAWPWVALLGGVLLALAGLLTVATGRAWPAMGARYDAPTSKAPAKAGQAGQAGRAADTPADLWKALDRGEDPTG